MALCWYLLTSSASIVSPPPLSLNSTFSILKHVIKHFSPFSSSLSQSNNSDIFMKLTLAKSRSALFDLMLPRFCFHLTQLFVWLFYKLFSKISLLFVWPRHKRAAPKLIPIFLERMHFLRLFLVYISLQVDFDNSWSFPEPTFLPHPAGPSLFP